MAKTIFIAAYASMTSFDVITEENYPNCQFSLIRPIPICRYIYTHSPLPSAPAFYNITSNHQMLQTQKKYFKGRFRLFAEIFEIVLTNFKNPY
jgi:hypothetical protein